LDTSINRGKETISSSPDEYRTSVKNLIQKEVGDIIDEEMRKAARAVNEYKSVIKQVVEEEKISIRMKMEEIRRSIIKLGLG
jgi:ATP-dependent Zn protease